MLQKICNSMLLLFALLLAFSAGPTAFAADTSVDFDKVGSITITLRQSSGNHVSIPGGTFTLYRVADLVKQNGSLVYRYTPGFSNCGASLSHLNAEGLAEHLSSYARQQKLADTTKIAGKNGSVTFTDLPLGLYLAVQKVQISGYYPIAPFLVSVPMMNGESTDWIYNVDASPKAQTKPTPPDGITKLTVKKVWSGKENHHPDSITVHLLRDGEIYKTVILNDENGWSYTWNHLSENYRWSVVEADVPKGYTVHYSEAGTTITITNSIKPDLPENPEQLTVIKIWSGDEGKDRPSEVTVELWNGDMLYDTVTLNEENGWKYIWTDLPESKEWEIREVNIPSHYEVRYSVDGTIITVENTFIPDTPPTPSGPSPESSPPPGEPPLIQTGQLNWPIPILAAAGVLLFALGWVLVFAKKRNRHEP